MDKENIKQLMKATDYTITALRFNRTNNPSELAHYALRMLYEFERPEVERQIFRIAREEIGQLVKEGKTTEALILLNENMAILREQLRGE